MAQRRFGSPDTERKLQILEEYLGMYQKALKASGFETWYVDAFAGSGEIPSAKEDAKLFDLEARDVIQGSAKRALEVNPPFDRYIFIDRKRACIDALQTRLDDHPLRNRIQFRYGDANDEIIAVCNRLTRSGQRAAFFLDPFGNQVAWTTVEAIARTEKADLWYLFPAGNGVFRQISNEGLYDADKATSITRLFGTEEWKRAFVEQQSQDDLFGPIESRTKRVTPESAAQFMARRMREVFQGGVLEEMIPLGKHAYASFYLIFAWANPSPNAKNLARKLARGAIKASDRRNGRLIRN